MAISVSTYILLLFAKLKMLAMFLVVFKIVLSQDPYIQNCVVAGS